MCISSAAAPKKVSHLVDGIMNALDPAKKEKYQRSAKAYTKAHLEAKKAAADKM